MFRNLIESSPRGERRPKSTFLLSTGVHLLALAALVSIPLVSPRSIQAEVINLLPSFTPPAPPAPPPPAGPAGGQPAKPKPVLLKGLIEPVEIPREIPPPEDIASEAPTWIASLPAAPGPGFLPGGSGTGFPGGPVDPGLWKAEAPPPPPPPRSAKKPLRVGGYVRLAEPIHKVQPVYPEHARRARIQGVVVLQAVIDEEGKVAELRVISGHLLLVPAALEAVRQWRYSPTLLNGQPVSVATTISVSFQLK